MAVAFRGAGAWNGGATGLTADASISVPTAQVVGDMMLLIGVWKDFAITAQVSGWTELFEEADGTSGTGNGSGSVKVGVWYKEATVDPESAPTLDFSTTTGLVGEGVIVVFSKSAGSWLAPTYVTGAINSWGTGGGTTSASTTIDVPTDGAVIGIAGIRDDSATFTRTTTSIDDAAGLVTWNGNYAEQPATHASTTTGNDLSCDAGYRLVTTGAAGVTLRQSGTLSATETGQAAWVVLATFTSSPQTVTPGVASLTVTRNVPTVTATNNQTVTPGVVSLTITRNTPTVAATAHQTVTPGVVALTATSFAPTVTASDHQIVTPGVTSLSLTAFTPVVTAFQGTTVTPGTASLTLSPQTPTVAATAHQMVVPGTASLSLTAQTPTITASDHKTVTPGVVSLTLTPFTPVVTAINPQLVTPGTASLTLTGFAPSIYAGITVVTGAGALSLTTFALDVTFTDNQLVTPGAATLALTAFAASVLAPRTVTPGVASLTITELAPNVGVGSPGDIVVGTATLALTTYAPYVSFAWRGMHASIVSAGAISGVVESDEDLDAGVESEASMSAIPSSSPVIRASIDTT